MIDVDGRVIAFLAEARRLKVESIQLDYDLVHDFGMDGDDAGEFFTEFGESFHIDLTALQSHWREHFCSEPPGEFIIYLLLMFSSVVAGGLLQAYVKWIPIWASSIALAVISCCIYGRYFDRSDQKLPVTVQDLVDAAREGRWIKNYGSE